MKINRPHSFHPNPPADRKEEGMPRQEAASRHPPAAPLQLLKGRVVRVEAGGRVQLAIGGEIIAARSAIPLRKDEEHWFEVRQAGAEPWLVLADKKGATQELLRFLATASLGEGGDWPGRDAAPPGSLPPEVMALWQGLARQLAGGMVEGVADPARILLSLLLLRAPGAEGERGSFRSQLQELLERLPAGAGRSQWELLSRTLALLEAVNSQPSGAGDPPFYIFPCMLAGSTGWGEWLLDLTPEEKSPGQAAGPSYGLFFFLQLSRLGELHLRISVAGETLRGEFVVATPLVRDYLQERLPEMNAIGAQLGFRQARFSCRWAEHGLLHSWQETLRQRLRSSLALVDIRT